MSFQPELLLHSALTILVVLAGLQDWRRGKVSNWIGIPLFLIGIVFAILRVGRLELAPLAIIALLVVLWCWKWMGGADVKMLTGLWGLWPAGAFWGMVGAGLWGLVLILCRHGKDRFPAVTALAFATSLTFLLENVSIILN